MLEVEVAESLSEDIFDGLEAAVAWTAYRVSCEEHLDGGDFCELVVEFED
jgi:hypothetical protein